MTLKEQIMKLQTYKMYEGEDTVYVERDDVLKALEQEPSDDCISRQAVLDIINFENEWLYDANSHNADTKIAFSGLKSKVKALSSVTPKAEWIPVSERLPESSGVYIVSRWFTDGFEEAILTDACYFDGTSTWHNDNRINHGREYVDKKIVAWMPLPEPYKAESEDEK